MAASWLIKGMEGTAPLFSHLCAGPIVLGRQDEQGDVLFQIRKIGGDQRLVMARPDEVGVSRRHVRLEALSENQIRVVNISQTAALSLPGGLVLPPGGASCVLPLPAQLQFGRRLVQIESAPSRGDDGTGPKSLDEPTLLPRGTMLRPAPMQARIPTAGSTGLVETGTILDKMRATMNVLRSAASDSEFLQQAAEALVEIVELDSACVLQLEGGTWAPMACFEADDAPPRDQRPSQSVLARLLREGKTVWHAPMPSEQEGSSLVGLNSIVASPILDRAGRIIGALYGVRHFHPDLSPERRICRLDAMMVDILAGSIAAGLARQEQERAASRMRSQFEQFFTPELAHQLAAHPELLDGQDLVISVLFCDIRSFSRITYNLGPKRTLEWTYDVLSTLSDCVLEQGGVLVDYVGDELMAMWGAPQPQSDHAQRACLAGLRMLERVQDLNKQWETVLGEPMGVGVGINTGLARVGNVGSRCKFKYGALGDTVNVASRVQGANKYFYTNILITSNTRDALGSEHRSRRIGQVHLAGMTEPSALHELMAGSNEDPDSLLVSYEEALSHFEARDFRAAARLLGNLVNQHPDDGPSLALLHRAVACLVEPIEPFDPAFRLGGK